MVCEAVVSAQVGLKKSFASSIIVCLPNYYIHQVIMILNKKTTGVNTRRCLYF